MPPPASHARWQVCAGILVLVIVLAAAIVLAWINPLAPLALVPVLGATGVLILRILGPRQLDDTEAQPVSSLLLQAVIAGRYSSLGREHGQPAAHIESHVDDTQIAS